MSKITDLTENTAPTTTDILPMVDDPAGTPLTQKVTLANLKTGMSLNNVTNTSDANKPVSTAQQTALDLKANLASPTFTGTVVVPDASFANAKLANMATKTYKGRTTAGTGVPEDVAVATLKTDLALVAGDVGLGNVTNESKATMFTSPALTGTPTAPTAAAGTNTTQLATTAFVTAINNNASYRTILTGSASHIAAKVAGNYALTLSGDPAAVGGTGTLYPQAIIAIRGADYPTINGIATKLRIVAQLYTNDVAPTGNFTFGLHPVTRPATSGGAGVNIFTIGTVVTGSNGAVFTTPAADGLLSAVGSDFAIPADGHYAIVMVTTATIATSAHVHAIAHLQLRNS